MNNIDREKVESKLTILISYVNTLKKIPGASLIEISSDPIKFAGIKYYLQISIESCLEIGAHLISRLHLRRFEGYKEIFSILGEANIIPNEFVHPLREMAGLRNMLVHLYWEIDNEEIIDIINNDLNDFEKFASYVAKFLKQQNGK